MPTSPEFDRDAALRAATNAASAASRILLGRYRSLADKPLRISTKGRGAIVTDADMEADRAIAAALDEAGAPGDFLSEESSRRRGGDGLTWLIDPLCGTTPFSTGMGHWGVNIALRAGPEIEVGVLELPTLGEQLAAVRGKGATRDGRPLEAHAPPGRLQDVAVALEIDGGPEWDRLATSKLGWARHAGQINSFTSAAYPIGQLLLGRLHAAVFYKIASVHLAAGAAIASELGVRVTDSQGARLDWTRVDDFECAVVGWPDVHAELIEALSG